MNLTCPSCRTRYREDEPPGAQVRCSRCGGSFAVADASRACRVEAATGDDPGAAGSPALASLPPRRLGFGMDDPSLAPRLGRTVFDTGRGGWRPALSWWRVAEDPPEDAAPVAFATLEEVEEGPASAARRRDAVVGRTAALLGGTGFGFAAGLLGFAGFGGTLWAWVLSATCAGATAAWMATAWKARAH